MRRVARLARPLRNALTTGRAGSVAAVVVGAFSGTITATTVVATRTAVGMEVVDTEEVSGAASLLHSSFLMSTPKVHGRVRGEVYSPLFSVIIRLQPWQLQPEPLGQQLP